MLSGPNMTLSSTTSHFDSWLAKQGQEKCGCCGRSREDIKRQRMNCQYHDEESNWITCCQDCFEEIQRYWDDMWREYYAGLY